MAPERLNVIALISGGKDSFFNQLHCMRHGHRIVALANLYPGASDASSDVQMVDPAGHAPVEEDSPPDATDLNSFMYQTVGHQVVPLYAGATGIPVYRMAIRGTAVHQERDYAHGDEQGQDEEETESMVPLLRAVMARHPEADAVSAGAILSTYQRTRVESVAGRLGLVPLAFLWKFPALPGGKGGQMLRDLRAAGVEARIVKVASAGLEERHLWELAGAGSVAGALGRFGGGSEGAVLGEGGEFETLVVDGPRGLFRRRIVVPEEGRRVVREGGGASWLMLRGARVEDKQEEEEEEEVEEVRVPGMFDAAFASVLESLRRSEDDDDDDKEVYGTSSSIIKPGVQVAAGDDAVLRWTVVASPGDDGSIEGETRAVVARIRALLDDAALDAAQVTTTLVVLRRMGDFARVNAEYGRLFTAQSNPPSRVTISCGALLAPGHDVMVCVAAHGRGGARDGLHVQSRSYWAPANIGPYSQAVGVAAARGTPGGVRAVYVAGQIPLVPASMALLPEEEEEEEGQGVEGQVVLALQHLWRVGAEMGVQMWTSAVAYFARCEAGAMRRRARLAARAWRLAHLESREEEEDEDEEEADEDGPDVWDLRYNPQYRTVSGAGRTAEEEPARLPDWSVLGSVPPVFAAEVEELPRQAAVEWHAHVGLSRVGRGDAEVVAHGELGAGWAAWHVVVRAGPATTTATLVYSVVTRDERPDTGDTMAAAYGDSLRRLGVRGAGAPEPYLVYLAEAGWTGRGGAVVPCRSIWGAGGRLRCVGLFELALTDSPGENASP